MQIVITHMEPDREKGPPILVFAQRRGAPVYGARNARHALRADLYQHWVQQ